MTHAPEIGQIVWRRYEGNGETVAGGMVTDHGITAEGRQYVIALVANPTYPKTSHRRPTFIHLHTEGAKYQPGGQIAELRRFYLDELAEGDGFRSVAKINEFAAKALIAAGVSRDDATRQELVAAYHALCEAAGEVWAEESERDRLAALQGVVAGGKRGVA